MFWLVGLDFSSQMNPPFLLMLVEYSITRDRFQFELIFIRICSIILTRRNALLASQLD